MRASSGACETPSGPRTARAGISPLREKTRRTGRAITSYSGAEPARRAGTIMLCSSVEFAPRGARDWLTALFLRSVVRIVVKPVLSPRVPIPWQRWWLKRLTLLIRPRRRVDIQDHVLGGVKGEWVRSGRTANAAQSAA